MFAHARRCFNTTSKARHENPLGLPLRRPSPGALAPPTIPRRAPGPPQKRAIPHVKKVLVVASGKGGVGKSTVAVNLAFALATHASRPRVGLLDLDVFGPSVPKLMGLERAGEPQLTSAGALVPLVNHAVPCMSMGFLLPAPPAGSSPSSTLNDDEPPSNSDTPVVWRGLMVQKAVQQLLFDVDWRVGAGLGAGQDDAGEGLDVLVVDLPPGTGDVPLTLGQLVHIDGAVIVSTPQDVALADVRKGVAMFRKISIPITGMLLNQAYFLCPNCATHHSLFGAPDAFRRTAARLGIDVLGELPLLPAVSEGGDRGVPYALVQADGGQSTGAEDAWKAGVEVAAASVLRAFAAKGD